MKVCNASVKDMKNVIKSTENNYRNEVLAIDKSIAKYRNIQSVLGVLEGVSIILAIVGFVLILGAAGSSDFEAFSGESVMSLKESIVRCVLGAVFVIAVYPISLITGKVCDYCDESIKNLKDARKECYNQMSYVKGAVSLLMRKMG